MLRIVRILSCAVVAAAAWLSALRLDHPPLRRLVILLVRRPARLRILLLAGRSRSIGR